MNMNHNISIHSGDPRLMDISLTSPEDLPPYDPSLTCTAPSDGPPSTIADPDVSHSGTGSVLGVSANGAIPAQPPQVPPTYLSSAMSTSSGDSSSTATASNNSGGHHGGHILNVRRQSAGSHVSSTHLRTFSNSASSATTSNQPKNTNPSSPFKKPLMGNLNQSILGGLSSNASDSGSSMATTGSGSGNNKRPPSLTESPFQSGHLPTIADVRSPDVLHVLQENCDCLSHPMQHSSSTEELNAEMKNLEGLMKDLNSMSPMEKLNSMTPMEAPSVRSQNGQSCNNPNPNTFQC